MRSALFQFMNKACPFLGIGFEQKFGCPIFKLGCGGIKVSFTLLVDLNQLVNDGLWVKRLAHVHPPVNSANLVTQNGGELGAGGQLRRVK